MGLVLDVLFLGEVFAYVSAESRYVVDVPGYDCSQFLCLPVLFRNGLAQTDKANHIQQLLPIILSSLF